MFCLVKFSCVCVCVTHHCINLDARLVMYIELVVIITSAAPSAKLRALPSTMLGAQETPVFNQTLLDFQQWKR